MITKLRLSVRMGDDQDVDVSCLRIEFGKRVGKATSAGSEGNPSRDMYERSGCVWGEGSRSGR